VNSSALGKDPWRFKVLDDQLSMYRQQWQADQQRHIIAKMAGKIPGKSNDGKRKNNESINHNNNGGRSGSRQGNNGRGGRERGRGSHGRRGNINFDHLKPIILCFNCGRKGHYSTDCTAPRKNENETSNMVSKADFKNLFQSSFKNMLRKKETQTKKKDSMDVYDESLKMNVFENLMEGKHNEIVSNDEYDSMNINSTNNLFNFGQNNLTDKSCLYNNYNHNYDEIAYPISKRIKLKHEPEAARK
jgi:hypothetical protein